MTRLLTPEESQRVYVTQVRLVSRKRTSFLWRQVRPSTRTQDPRLRRRGVSTGEWCGHLGRIGKVSDRRLRTEIVFPPIPNPPQTSVWTPNSVGLVQWTPSNGGGDSETNGSILQVQYISTRLNDVPNFLHFILGWTIQHSLIVLIYLSQNKNKIWTRLPQSSWTLEQTLPLRTRGRV